FGLRGGGSIIHHEELEVGEVLAKDAGHGTRHHRCAIVCRHDHGENWPRNGYAVGRHRARALLSARAASSHWWNARLPDPLKCKIAARVPLTQASVRSSVARRSTRWAWSWTL